MPLDLEMFKMDVWDRVRKKTGGRRALLATAVTETERAFAMLHGSYPFKDACDANSAFLREAVMHAIHRPRTGVELFSIKELYEGGGDGNSPFGIASLNELERSLMKPLLHHVLEDRHRDVVVATIGDPDYSYIAGKTLWALTAHCNANGLVPLFIMEFMVDVITLFHACAATGYKQGYDDLTYLVRSMSDGLVLGELKSARIGRRGVYAALTL